MSRARGAGVGMWFVAVLVVTPLVVTPLAAATAQTRPEPPGGLHDVVGLPAWDVARTTPIAKAALDGVAAIGADTWAVGMADGSTLIERWDGGRFVRVPSPNLPSRDNVLEDVAGSSGSDVWAVGHADDPDLGLVSDSLVEHWDGTSWSIVRSPSVPDHANTLTGVVALSATDAWAVGTVTSFRPGASAILLHWDGARWRTAKNACGPNLNEIDARTASDIWAVGGADSCHFDGSRWVDVPLAPPSNPQHWLDMRDLTVVGGSDIWAVGDEVSECGESICHSGVVEHWSGRSWTYVTGHPALPVLYGVDATASDDVYAVGLGLGPAIVHFDGSGWQDVPNPYAAAALRSVAVSGGDAWAVGERAGARPRPFAEQAPSPTSGAVVGDTAVSGATVSWFGKESGSVETDPFGGYQVGGLRAGRYTFTATYAGCQPVSQVVRVHSGRTIRQNLPIDCRGHQVR